MDKELVTLEDAIKLADKGDTIYVLKPNEVYDEEKLPLVNEILRDLRSALLIHRVKQEEPKAKISASSEADIKKAEELKEKASSEPLTAPQNEVKKESETPKAKLPGRRRRVLTDSEKAEVKGIVDDIDALADKFHCYPDVIRPLSTNEVSKAEMRQLLPVL